MQLLMLLAILAAMIMPSLAERDERMNNVPGERKFLQQMRQKRRVELFFCYVIAYHATIPTNTNRSDEIV
jgi:hypothetical protein